ncbi:flavodoxin-like fold protein [Elasticomyces elasticus]|nr:flavodoxin-like fold protein [Elasticomyces elasticus]
MAPKIAIVYYSMYGHIKQLADAEAKGIKEAGGSVDLYQVPETLPQEVLTKMHAPAKDSNVPTIDDPKVLEQYDAVLFGIPTRYGNFPAQFKAFWDKTGGQWQTGKQIDECNLWRRAIFVSTDSDKDVSQTGQACSTFKTSANPGAGAFWGKYAGLFISTGTQGGGQESTAIAAMSTLAHHGWIYVPLGYKTTFDILADLSEVRGGSPWGAGTFSGGDGSRQPSSKELDLAQRQGKAFYETVAKVNFA